MSDDQLEAQVGQNRETRHFPAGWPDTQCPNCGYYKVRRVDEVEFWDVRRFDWLPIFTKKEAEKIGTFDYCTECAYEFNDNRQQRTA